MSSNPPRQKPANPETTNVNSWKQQGRIYAEKNKKQPVKVYTPEEIAELNRKRQQKS